MDITSLVIGLIVGWLLEWVIDWLFWRRRRNELRDELESCRATNRDLLAKSADADQVRNTLATVQAEVTQSRVRLADASRAHEALVAAQAVEVAGFKAQLAEADQTRTALAAAQVEIDDLRAQLLECRKQAETVGAARFASTSLAPTQLEEAPTPPATFKRDPLIDINGIGPVFEQRLFEAGIYTFAQLAALAPERVREIIAPQSWQKIKPEAWIAEAREFAKAK